MFKGIYGASIFVKDQASGYSFARELVDADCTVAIMKQNRMKVPVESIYNINNKEQWKRKFKGTKGIVTVEMEMYETKERNRSMYNN